MSDYLKSEIGDVKKKGFGIIPKLVMADERLTIEAKAIYSYMASYAGAGDTAFPGVERMIKDLGIGENRFYKHRKMLVDLGYITITKTRKEGKRDNNIYILNQIIARENKSEKQHLQNEGIEKQHLQIQHLQNEGIQNQCIENEGTNNNSSLKSTVLNNNSIKQQQQEKEENKDIKDLEDVVVVLDNKINIQEAKTILKAAKGDIKLIKAKYEIAKVSNYENLVAWMTGAIKGDWQMPTKQKDKSKSRNNTKFHNFEQRTSKYTPEQLKEMVLSKK